MRLNIVVDANILFSFFKSDSTARELITRFESLSLYAPELALEELLKYKELICKRSRISNIDFEDLLDILKTFVSFEAEDIFNKFLSKAKELSPDIDDAAYFALALKLGCSMWSNEKKLKEQSKVEVLATGDIVKLLRL